MKWKPDHLYVKAMCPGFWMWVCSPVNPSGPIASASWAPHECSSGHADTQDVAYTAALAHAEGRHGVKI